MDAVKPGSSERGSILIMVALSMTTLLTILGFMFSAGLAYDVRAQLSAAADNAARAGAFEVLGQGDALSDTALSAFGQQAVAQHGTGASWLPTATVTTVRCNRPGAGCTAPYNTKQYVKATATRTIDTLFAGFLPATVISPSAWAVAGVASSGGCIVTLGGSPSLSIGNSTITAAGCDVSIGGAGAGTNPNSTITADHVTAVTCPTCTKFTPLTVGVPPPADPLASLAAPAIHGTCVDWTGNGTLSAGCYHDISVPSAATLATGGNFVITGTLTLTNNSSLTGNDVFVYLSPSASLDIGQHVVLTLAAHTAAGAYAGIAFYMDRANPNDVTFQNNSGMDITGAFYAPNADVSVGNSLGNGGTCSVIVVHSLAIGNGNGHFDNTCSAVTGGSPLHTVTLAE